VITFEDARQVVQAQEQLATAPYGYEGAATWYPVLMPARDGGRTPAVDKQTSALSWVSSTTSDDFANAEPVGASRNAPAPRAITWLTPLDRVYKRDSAGRFGAGGSDAPGVRAALKDATTLDDLNEAAINEANRITGRSGYGPRTMVKGGAIEIDMRHSDLEVAKQHLEGVLKGLEKFPDAPLRRVADFDPDAPTKSLIHYGDMAEAFAYASMGFEQGSINFNARYSANPAKYEHALALSAEHTVSTTPGIRTPHLAVPTMQGVALHEFGHILTSSPSMGPRGGEGSPTPRIPAKRVATEMKPPDQKTTSGYLRREISEYAATNQHELSGEAFADVMTHGADASPVSKAIYNEITALYPGSEKAP
jgi:hypothetical protein